MSSIERVNCFECKHFYVTWDKSFPKGCKKFGFKSKEMPSANLERNTGHSCPCFDYSERYKRK